MKSYTDLEQSKKLAEILPVESADMYWKQSTSDLTEDITWKPMINLLYKVNVGDLFSYRTDLPCWSLAALLDVLAYYPTLHRTISGWRCDICNEKGCISHFGDKTDNPVDACVAMIEKLHELNLL